MLEATHLPPPITLEYIGWNENRITGNWQRLVTKVCCDTQAGNDPRAAHGLVLCNP
jgi:hypothetical protein